MTVVQVLNTKGQPEDWDAPKPGFTSSSWPGKLKAYAYDEEGVLMERMSDQKRQGQGLYFFAEEVDTYQPEVQRRPRGSKNKQIRPEAKGAKTA